MRAAQPTNQRDGYIFLIIFIFLAAGILAAAISYYKSYERRFRTQIENQLSAVAELKVGELRQWRAERLGDAESIFNNSLFCALVKRFLLDPKDKEAGNQLQSWISSIYAAYRYDRVFLLDSKGAERICAPISPERVAPHLVADAAQAMRLRQIIFADFHRDVPGGPVYLGVIVPIRDALNSGKALGVMVLRADPNVALYPLINRWPTPSRTAETLIVRRDGEDVLFLNNLRFGSDAALNLRIPLLKTDIPAVKAVLGQAGIVEGRDYRGVPVLAALRAIAGSPWYMVARIDTAEAFAPLSERLWMTAGFVGALLLSAGGSVSFLWRHQRVSFLKERFVRMVALQESEERFRRAVVYSPFPMLLHADDGAIIFASNSWCEISGYTREELATIADWTERAYGERKTQVQSDIDLLYALDRRKAEGDYRIRTKYGTTRIWDCSSAPIGRLPDGRRVVLSMAMDVTERREAEHEVRLLIAELDQRVQDRTSQLEAANRELEAFSYSVSHDLRAPLRAIDGFGRILQENYAERLDSEGRRLLSIISGQTRNTGQLIDDLLAFSRLNRQSMESAEINMTAQARAVFEQQAACPPERALKLELKPLPPANGDGAMMRVMWNNLLSNAIKFTQHKGEAVIEIGSHLEDGQDIYYVKDNGVGFDMKYAHKLFGVFQRLHSAEEFEGTGVGLALVQRVIHRHGGRVWAEGKVNEGAAFYFSLPRMKGKS